MKKLGVYCAILMLIPGAVPGSAAELAFPGQADLSVLVQRSGAAAENLRLGELALENNDDYAAAEFLSSALQGRLDDPSAQLRAANYLHRSYLRTNQKALADELLEQLRTQKEFANEKQLLLLMQIRTEAFAGNHSKVIELCRQAEIADQTGNQASCELLELQGRAFQCLGDCKAARQSFERLLKLAGKDDCARLVALDGIVLNSLGLKDTNQARKALDTLKKTVPEVLQKKFAARLQQLEWLTEASAGNTAAMETPFRFLAEKSEPPNVLLSRIALLLGDNYSSKKEFAAAGKYYAIAFKLAEIDFKQTALGAMLKNDLTAGDLKSALEHTRLYRKLYPAADDAHTMALLEAHLHNHLKDGKSAESTYLMLQKDDRVPQDIRYASALELIKIYQKSNRSGDAEKLFRFAINIAPDLKQKNILRQLLGEYFYQLGNYQEAAGCFKEAAGEGSERSAFWLAQTYYRQESFDLAERALQMFTAYTDKDLQRRADYLQALITEKLRGIDDSVAAYMNFASRYPKAPEAPDALFRAGVLARTSNQYRAYDIFRRYASDYPGPQAANALYKALNELLARGNGENAGKLYGEMLKKYESSKYTISGGFAMVDFLRRNKKYAEAHELLNKLDKLYTAKHPELVPEILYDRAVLNGEMRDYKAMEQALETLTLKYSAHPLAPQAFFLLGDLKMLQGDNKAALSAFQQAHERSGGGTFAFCCLGRTADAAFALYSAGREEQYLRQAADGYENLLKVNDLPADLYVQTLYKYGRCLEENGKKSAALHCYRKLLYEALLAKRQSRYYSSQWSAKALDAALKLLGTEIRQKPDDPQSEELCNEALYLLQIAGALGLDNEDIEKRRQALNMLRRKSE